MNRKQGCLLTMIGVMLVSITLAIRQSQTGHSRPWNHSDASFDISPDGKEVVMSQPGPGGDMNIFIYGVENSIKQAILVSENYEWSPKFSSDGSKVVYVAGLPGDRADHLFIYDRKSRKSVQLTSGDFNDTSPSFYDHDHKILFTREDQYRWGGLSSSWNEGGKVYSLDLATNSVSLIYDQLAYRPEVTNQDTMLYSFADKSWLIDIKSGKERKRFHSGRWARISRDGRYIVGEADGQWQFKEIATETNKERNWVESEAEDCSQATVSPDGRYLYFMKRPTSESGYNSNLLMRLNRSNRRIEEKISPYGSS